MFNFYFYYYTSSYFILKKTLEEKNYVKIEDSRMYSLKPFSFTTDSVYMDLFIFIIESRSSIFVNILFPLSNFLLLYPSRWFIVWSNDFYIVTKICKFHIFDKRLDVNGIDIKLFSWTDIFYCWRRFLR